MLKSGVWDRVVVGDLPTYLLSTLNQRSASDDAKRQKADDLFTRLDFSAVAG